MNQQELFSKFANQKLHCSIYMHASKREVMFSLPHNASCKDGLHSHYVTVTRPRGKVEQWLTSTINKVLKEHGFNFDAIGWDMTWSKSRTLPGVYLVDIWQPKKG